MRIEVLGPIRVKDDGAEIALERKQLRLVLALLVEAKGQVLTTDQLVDRVWGEKLPDHARKTIQGHVSKLRSILHDPDAIETTGGGYRLGERTSTDVDEFESLIGEAHKHLADRPEHASTMLRQALAMWRGPPYADLRDEQSLQTEIRRIEELHLIGLEDRIAADIATGEEADVVAQLEGLIDQHPLRERLHGLHMTALYRGGRQTEALATYQRLRRTLNGEFGLDPSPQLQELELQILRQDPALGAAPQHRLRNPLPARYSSFVGRDTELDDIHQRLAGHRLVTITGVGGIGKSSLAIEAARAFENEIDLTYVDLESIEAADVAMSVARAMGLGPISAEDAQMMISHVIAESSSILLLDGCEHIGAAVAEMANRLLRANRELRLLVTSREALHLPGESLLVLNPLNRGTRSPAVELFLDRFGVHDVEQEQLIVVAAICDQLDGLPLAIELAASRARSMPLPDVAARLDRQIELLIDRTGSLGRHASLTAAMNWSYELLAEDRRNALRSLSVFRSGFEPDAAGDILEKEDTAEVLADLVATSLVAQRSPNSRYRMLEPVRQYAWSLVETADQTEILSRRHADWAVKLARHCRDHRHGSDQIAVYGRAAVEHCELIAAIRWSLSSGTTHAVEIIAAIGRMWYSVGVDRQLRVLMLEAVEHPSVTPSAALAVAMSHTGFAWYFEDASPPAISLVEEAVEMARDVGDDGALGTTLSRLAGVVTEGLGDPQRGLELDFEAYELLERSGHPDVVRESYNLAQILADLGRVEEAANLLRDAIETAVSAGPPAGEVTALYGHYLIALGQIAEGIAGLERGIEMLERLGRHHTLIAANFNLGLAYSMAGRHDEALAGLHRSAAAWTQFGRDPLGRWLPPLDLVEARANAPDRRSTEAAIRSWIGSKVGEIDTDVSNGAYHSTWTMPSELLLIAHPASVVAENPESAAQIGASALRLMTGDRFGGWKGVGEIDRLRDHLEQLPQPAAPVPVTPHDLLVLLTETFGARHLPEPPAERPGTT